MARAQRITRAFMTNVKLSTASACRSSARGDLTGVEFG
jgi:hypothetical protein